jgi:hypothetical protein
MTSNSFFSSGDRRGQNDRRLGYGDCTERLAHPQSGNDPRSVRYQALRQVAHLGARIGDDLLALTIIELLRHLKCLAGRPAEARAAEFLQRRQIMQLGWPLPLILDAFASAISCAISRRTRQGGRMARASAATSRRQATASAVQRPRRP